MTMTLQKICNQGYNSFDQFTQKELVKIKYPGCKTYHLGKVLVTEFTCTDVDFEDEYKVKILYYSQQRHRVFIEKPVIKPSIAIHMYLNGSLCLYYPPDISPFRRIWIATDLIPLTIQWICHYELWLKNGNIWLGQESPGHEKLLWLNS